MYTEGFDQWFKLCKNINTPFTEWNKTTTEVFRNITQQQLEILEDNMSRVSEQLKRLSGVKKPEDWITLQKDCITEDVTATMEYLQKMSHLSLETMTKMSKLCNVSPAMMAGSKTPEHSDR